jgi:carbohydrate diacid regulator
MKLTSTVAHEIRARARTVLNREVIVADDSGTLLTGDTAGTIAVDALRACQEGRIVRAELDDNQISWCPFVYENRTVGAFGVIEEGVQVTPEAISLLQGLAEVIVHQQFLLDHVQPSEKMRASFLRQVLSSNTIDADEAYRQADILQLNLRLPQAVMLVEISNLEKDIVGEGDLTVEERENKIAAECSRIRELLLEAFQNNSGDIAAYLGKNQFVICKSIGGESLTTRNTARYLREKSDQLFKELDKALPKRTVTIGVGQYYPELGGLRKSYQEARLSLLVGIKVWGAGRVYHIKQVGMFVTLANVAQERKAELAHQILHPLLRDSQLYKTVQTFLNTGLNLTEAAEKLHVHRNTLIYRLDKTKKVIGLDPRVFDDALQIKLGLMFYQEQPATA